MTDALVVVAQTAEPTVPAWLAIIGAGAAAMVAIFALLTRIHKVASATQRQVDSWNAASRKVANRQATWDSAADRIADAADKLARTAANVIDVKAAVVALQQSVTANTEALDEIRAQVTVDAGESLKDQVILGIARGNERHARLDERLEHLESSIEEMQAHLSAQDDRAADQHHELIDRSHGHRDDLRPGGSTY